MIERLGEIHRLANRHAGKLLLLGLAGVAGYNWWRWQKDRALLAEKARPAPPPDWETWPELPKVSVLVAAWNEADIVERHIRSFLKLSYPSKELILCAGGSDGTYDLSRQYAGEQVVVLKQQAGDGKQGALQRCLERAGGDLIFLTDADCVLDDESCLRTLAPLVQEGEQVATGLSRPLDDQVGNPFVIHQWCADTYAAAVRQGKYVSGLKGANCALWRTALETVGGFQAGVSTGTDYYLAKQLLAHGYRIRSVPGSINQTEYSETFSVHAQRQSRWLRNLMVHGRRFQAQAEVWAALRTSLLGLGVLLFPITFLVLGPIAACAWGLALTHGLLARLRYFAFAQIRHRTTLNRRYLCWLPMYMLSDFATWSLPLVDLLLRRERW